MPSKTYKQPHKKVEIEKPKKVEVETPQEFQVETPQEVEVENTKQAEVEMTFDGTKVIEILEVKPDAVLCKMENGTTSWIEDTRVA
jgi:hypothetical protein